MKFYSLASGSSGNCVCVSGSEANILIDAGISAKRIEAGLALTGLNGAMIDALFITHEHIDHIGGVGVLIRKYGMPVYCTKGTYEGILATPGVGCVPGECFRIIDDGDEIVIGDLHIFPFTISHDARQPVAYTIESCGSKLGMATDLGYYDDRILEKLQGCSGLYLEANHDVNMLMVGTYPYRTKIRIAGEKGHLSNETSAELVSRIVCDKLRCVVLAHMSKDNNYPELAYVTVKQSLLAALGEENLPRLEIAARDNPSNIYEI